MEKKTFLGIDITPRRELWAEIKRLGKQIEIQERHLVDERKAKDREIDAIIARYIQPRCPNGRFTKRKQ